MAGATALAAVLAVTAAAVGSLVGPCMQVLTDPGAAAFTFEALFGPRLAPWVERLTGLTQMPATELLALLPWLLAAVALVKSVCGLGQWFLWEWAGEGAARDLREAMAGSFLAVDPQARRRAPLDGVESALASTSTGDVRQMREFVVHFYGGLPREIMEATLLGVTLVFLSPKLTAIFLLGVVPAGVAGSKIGRVLRRRAARALADYADMTEWIQQRLLGIETIKHYRTEALETARFHEHSERLHDRFLRAARTRARTSPVMEGFAVLAIAAVLAVALSDVAAGRTTGAVQLSFFSTLALLSQAAGKLGRYVNSNREGAAAVDRIRGALVAMHGVARPSVAPTDSAPGPARIVCRDLTLRYPGTEAPALDAFTFTFEGGTVHCLAGPSGAGKSTLFNVLLGLARADRGEVTFAGGARPSSGASRAEPIVAYMPQRVILTPGTVAENVAYPDVVLGPAEEGRVREALAKVNLVGVVDGLAGGIHAAVGEGGAGLSGGQAQRLLLARLWYRRAPVVLVDEGTSALDPEVERTVHDLLKELAREGAVIVMIAHRRAAAEMADVALLLENGRLVASGDAARVVDGKEWRRVLSGKG
jgi:ABC-type multidrug transport system fused ATPase/permease subunit